MQKHAIKHTWRGAEWQQWEGVGAAAESGQRAENERTTSGERFSNDYPKLTCINRLFFFRLTNAKPFCYLHF